jgi:hypothetical protein
LLTNLQEQREEFSVIRSNETRVLKAKENANPVHNKHKHKIILKGDNQAQGCAKRLIYKLGNSSKLLGYVKPNPHVGKIISTVKEEPKNLTNSDVLVLCGSSRNTGKMSPQKGSTISTHTFIHTALIFKITGYTSKIFIQAKFRAYLM